ncbi:MAG TPA: hypothetical protein VMH04_09230 [Candidatus Solibacter sp.]|nr:hypothetical protein [Candidatus Solibacter sp.]
MRNSQFRLIIVAASFLLSGFCSFSAAQQISGPFIVHEARRAVSLPVRDLPIATAATQQADEEELENQREGRFPHAVDLERAGYPFDAALQLTEPTTINVTMGVNFDGVPGVTYTTSDVNGSVGSTQYVQYTNWRFAVYNKSTGAKVAGPTAEATLFAPLGGPCGKSNDGDIIVLYDKQANRWVLSHHAVVKTGPFYQCFAISKTSDATGAYYLYAFPLSNNFPDYPKLGIWSDGYYLSSNLENLTNFGFIASQVCAFNRTQMLAGATTQNVCFQTSQYQTLLPGDIDGATAPPSGSPEIFMGLGATALELFKFKVNWTNLSQSVFSGPTAIPVAAYSEACRGLDCIPQADTSQVLDSLADRLMFRLAFRNYGTFQSVVVTHSVVAGSSTGLRWYEIRSPFTTPTIHQQGTYAPDNKYRWMGSIAMDKVGDMALGYSISSAAQHPGINFTGRLVTDPLNTMESEVNVVTGNGSEQPSNYRWGDYDSMSIDPTDDCTFWYTNQYYKTDSLEGWSTRVVSFKFPSCK